MPSDGNGSRSNLAREWISLQAGGPEKRDNGSGAEQTFFNDWLGLAYEADNKAVDWEVLRDRGEEQGFRRGVVPAEALALVLGLDVQGDRVEWLLVGYGRNRYRAVIDHGVVDNRAGSHLPGYKEHSGHISEPEVRAALDKLLQREWTDELGRSRAADRLAIDGNAYTDDVWNWVRKHPKSRVIMVRGGNTEAAPPIMQTKEYDKRGKPKKQKWSSRFAGVKAAGGAFNGDAVLQAVTNPKAIVVNGLPAGFALSVGDYVEVRKSPLVRSLHRITAPAAANEGRARGTPPARFFEPR